MLRIAAMLYLSKSRLGSLVYRGIRRFAEHRPTWDVLGPDRFVRRMEHVIREKPDAAIIHAGAADAETIADLMAAGTQVVNISNRDPAALPCCSVLFDDVAAGRLAAEHLLEQGYRHFAWFSPPGLRFSDERRAGLASGLDGRTLVELTAPQWNSNDPHEAMRIELEQMPRPFAVVCGDGNALRAVMTAATQLGLNCPQDFGIISVDCDGLDFSDLFGPELSLVRLPAEDQGYMAAEFIDAMLRGESVPSMTRVPVTQVLGRQSTAGVVSDDPMIARAQRLIREQADRAITVEDLLDHLNVSRRWLEIHFREETGRTVQREIDLVRIDLAKNLLADGALSVGEVAVRAGFSSYNHLARAFRRVVGMTPGDYRKSLIDQPQR